MNALRVIHGLGASVVLEWQVEIDGDFVVEAVTCPIGANLMPACPWIVASKWTDDYECAVLRYRVWRRDAAPLLALTWYGPGPTDVKTSIESVSGASWSDVEQLHQYLANALGQLLKRGRRKKRADASEPKMQAIVKGDQLYRDNHGHMTHEQIAARAGLPYGTYKYWRKKARAARLIA